MSGGKKQGVNTSPFPESFVMILMLIFFFKNSSPPDALIRLLATLNLNKWQIT